ncbi:hypothetical protein Tco_1294068 [Tanacetum coccineum]
MQSCNCITKFLKEVNSRAKVQSPKTRNNNKLVEPKSHTQKPGRQMAIGQRFSLNKSSAVHEKPNTPRSCLRWIPTGRIFKLVSLRWIPTAKMFIDSTTKVDSEPPNGSNEDITNPYEYDQTLNVSAGTLNLSVGLVPQSPSPTPNVPPTKNDWDSLFCPMFDEYFNPSPSVVQPVLVAGVQEPVVSTEPSSEESSSRIVIPTNVHSVNQPQEHIEKWTKDHPLDKIIGDPSRPVSTRLQLQTEALFCYYDALLSSSEHKSYKDALTESCWIDAMKSSMSLNIWRFGSLQIKEQKENGVVELYFVGTEFQLADIFSKPLGQEKLEFLMKKVGMQSMSPKTLKKLADETEELWCTLFLDQEEKSSNYPNNFPSMILLKIICVNHGGKEHPSDMKVLTMKMEILLEPTSNKLLVVGFNLLVHSFRALSTLRRSGLRTASAAAKPCQGDSSKVYLITGRIPTVAAAGQRHVNSQPHAHTSYF